ncbi:MAG: PorP/SprF family type IX secretion system membrane protein [Flavobacteriales bacterium]|nr:PorP/SprF family type IX secretion system membrane protein [Flavobacteriales bacterium]
MRLNKTSSFAALLCMVCAIGAFGLFTTDVNAQQVPRRSQFIHNPFLLNPAMAGIQPGTFTSANYRNQWAGFDGAPTTFSISAAMGLPNRFGAGIVLEQDDMGGAMSRTGVELTGTYTLDLNNQDAVSFGLGLLAQQLSFDGRDLEVWEDNDPALTGALETSFTADARFGMMVFGKNYAFGMAIPNLMQNAIGWDSEPTDQRNRLIRHYLLMGHYRYLINNEFTFKPAAVARFTGITPAQLDAYLNLSYRDMLWGGIGFRQSDAIVLSIGGGSNDVRVTYSYDLTTSDVGRLSPHTHEITISYFLARQAGGFNSRNLGGRILDRGWIIRN